MRVIYSCPDCDGDLVPDSANTLWCPACEQVITDAKFLGDDPDD